MAEVFLPIVLLEGVPPPDLPGRVLSTAVVVALIPPLLWRRTRPLLTAMSGHCSWS